MHISNVRQVLLVLRRNADPLVPRMNQVQDLRHHPSRILRRALRESSNKLIQKPFRRYLQLQRVPNLRYERFEQRESEEGNVWVSVVDIAHDHLRRFERTARTSHQVSPRRKSSTDIVRIRLLVLDILRNIQV